MNRPLAAAAAALILASCAKPPGMQSPQGPSLAPSSNVFLRNSFDTDPSSYIGRFVPEGLTALDETAAMPLACSQHITYRYVEGGGVRYTEYLNTSSEVSARLGVPIVANGKGHASTAGMVRVEYELTGKLIGEVADPVAFNQCCQRHPQQCTTRYVGEFLEGTGAVYHLADRSASTEVSVITPRGSGDLDADHGTHWERAVEFPNPVYFAFKTAGTTHEQSTGTDCTDWMANIPERPGRTYVLGVSRNDAKNETAARNRALMNASNNAVMAGLIAYDFPTFDEEGQEVPADQDLSTQLPSGVTADDWCVQRVRTDKGDRYRAKVLAWVDTPESTPARPSPGRGGSGRGGEGQRPNRPGAGRPTHGAG